jgi:hypothetical protein
MEPDPWQTSLLRGTADRVLLNCSRQSGKSVTAAALALQTALCVPGSLTLLLSPTLRQSGELFRDKVLILYHANGRPLKATRETALELTLANGSRIISLPGEEGTIRGYSSVDLLVVDEAARVPDSLYIAVRPMLAVSEGRLICLSTPFGRQGFFYDEWRKDLGAWSDSEFSRRADGWTRYRVPAWRCPRISQEFLDKERLDLGDRWYRQEYGCEFTDMTGAVFSGAEIDRAFVPLGGGIAWKD